MLFCAGAANISRTDHTKKGSIFHHSKMNPFANILEYLSSAPVSDIGWCSYRKVRRKNTYIGRVSLILKINTFSVFSLKLALKKFLTYSTGEQTILNTFLFSISKYKGHIMKTSRKRDLKKTFKEPLVHNLTQGMWQIRSSLFWLL